MKNTLWAVFCLLVIRAACLGQQSVDNSSAAEVRPYPQVTIFPGSCKVGDHITRVDQTPGSNDYSCNPGANPPWTLVGSSGTIAPQSCTPPQVLIGVGASATCAAPIIVTSGTVAPQSGIGSCGAPTGGLCVYFFNDSVTNTTTQYIQTSGSGLWVDMSLQHLLLHQSSFATLPNPSAYPVGTPWYVYDCSDYTCPGGGGNIGEFFISTGTGSFGTSWTVQAGGSNGGSGANVICYAPVAGSGSISLNQTCQKENFIISLASGSNVVTSFTGAAAGYEHTYTLIQPLAGGATFTCASIDKNCGTLVNQNGSSIAIQTFQAMDANDFIGGIMTQNIQPSLTVTSLSVGTTTVGTIPNGMLGLSYDVGEMLKTWCPMCAASSSSQATRLIGLITALGTYGTIRINSAYPYSQNLTYTPSLTSTTASSYGCTAPATCAQSMLQIGPGPMTNFARFMCALPSGWKTTWGVPNDFTTADGPTPLGQSDSLSAQEVAELYSLLGPSGSICTNRIAAIEIGNEPDGQNNYFTASNTTGPGTSSTVWAARWNTIANAIKAVTPGVTFVGPSVGQLIYANTYIGQFLAGSGGTYTNAQLLIGGLVSQHYYEIGTVGSATIATLMGVDSNLLGSSGLGGVLGSYATSAGLPMQLNETSTVANGGAAGVSNTFASALWGIDYPLTLQESYYGYSTTQPLTFAYQACGGFGNCYSQGYTPIQDSNSGTYANPLFTGMYFAHLMGTGNLVNHTLTNGGLNMTAHAVTSGGTTNTIVFNKDSTYNAQMTVTFSATISTASYVVLTNTSLAQITAPTMNGVTMTSSGSLSGAIVPVSTPVSGSHQVTIVIPAHSAVLLTTS